LISDIKALASNFVNTLVIPALIGNPEGKYSYMKKTYYVYILASKKNGTLYIGVTNDLLRRVYEHKHNLKKGFSSAYDVHKLVYFEQTDDINAAIDREKQLKKWNRDWKLKLIEDMNPKWKDLYYEYGGKDFEAGIGSSLLKD
jgi:putative endonuclease